MCPRSSDPFYIVRFYLKWVITSWTFSIFWKILAKGTDQDQRDTQRQRQTETKTKKKTNTETETHKQ